MAVDVGNTPHGNIGLGHGSRCVLKHLAWHAYVIVCLQKRTQKIDGIVRGCGGTGQHALEDKLCAHANTSTGTSTSTHTSKNDKTHAGKYATSGKLVARPAWANVCIVQGTRDTPAATLKKGLRFGRPSRIPEQKSWRHRQSEEPSSSNTRFAC